MPSPQNREEVLFAAALVMPADKRPALLGAMCAGDPALRQRLDDMLAAHQKADELPPPVAPAVVATIKLDLVEAEDEAIGKTIGRYKVLEKVGEGGCGVVYVAEQTVPVRRRVALKVIKLGMDTKQVVARFEAERQALAIMDHPNIAKVLDAGATDSGRPYFVMELVKGERITDYCDKHKLSTRERLDLFVKICHAIQHAHQKGIIHRDIKPSNILVAMHDGVPVPKVIDFGIAKATEQRLTEKTVYTALEQMIGTPAYMSPEQAEMTGLDIDTRSDIYSLGVLLYELLTGSTPFDAHELVASGLELMRRTIREKEPARPSTRLTTMVEGNLTATAKLRQTDPSKLIRLLRGDLDWIVMKCLEKDRTRRYETANGLSSDLLRHVNNEPVIARPPSNAYRFQKAWRRNKGTFAAATMIAIVLVTATGISAWQAVRATRAQTLAKQRLAESEAISKFLTEVFRSPDPERDGRAITAAETLGAAADKLETDLANQPAYRAELQATLAQTYDGLGLFREAIPLQEKVRDYYLAASGPEHPDTLTAMNNLAHFYEKVGRRDEAIKLDERGLTLRRKVNGPEHPDTLQAMGNLAVSLDAAGRQDEAIKLGEQVLALRRRVSGPEHPDTLQAMGNLAISLDAAGRRDEALKLQEELLVLNRKISGPDNTNTLEAMHELARYDCSVGRNEEGIALLEKSCELDPKDIDASEGLATWQTWFGKDADYEAARLRLVQQAEGTGQAPKAERAAKVYCLRPSADTAVLTKVLNLAWQAVELRRSSPLLPWYQLTLGLAEYRNGQYAAAEHTLVAAEQTAGDYQTTARLFRAMSLFRQDRLEEARTLFSQAEAQMHPLPADERKPLVDGRMAYHDLLICWLAYKEARSLLNESATGTTAVHANK
jgi:eukaryotic-like serine/threonine-protein kinase